MGMFVSGLDRPWTQTPFPLQGFYIRDLEEIKELKARCRHVYIDVLKGAGPLKSNLKTLSGLGGGAVGRKDRPEKRAETSAKLDDVAPIKVRKDVYSTDVEPLSKEIENARSLHQEVYQAVNAVMTQVDRDHQKIPFHETKRAACAMVDSVVRSPDAFTWLSRVRDKDEHTYSHAVRSAVWAILFGRHIGMSTGDLEVLALGVLLKDLGKTRLPKHVLEAKKRTPSEQKQFESFVDIGVDILREIPDVKPRVTSVVKTHCERANGSGFPAHLRGDRIPLLGKIAGIVTYYDETTNPRGQHPLSPSKAVAKLYEQRGIQFQADLVVEFIRAIGLYPTGTLVELNTGELAVVVEQNFSRRLKPKVMVVTDSCKEPLLTPIFLDMAQDDKDKQAKIDSGKVHPSEIDRYEIVQDLEPGSYDVDASDVCDQYLDRNRSRKGFGLFKGKKIASLFGA